MSVNPGHDAGGFELPQPDEAAAAHSARLVALIVDLIRQRGGPIGFDEYMRLALYEPGLGYYAGSANQFGAGGDFVTAPEISPLFGRCVARQAAALVEQGCGPSILEFGAGSGRLCGDILEALPVIESYRILDLGAELKQRQMAHLRTRLDPDLSAKVEWLSRLPADFDGIVVANEVLDAMPVHRLEKGDDGWRELGVGFDGHGFIWTPLPVGVAALAALDAIETKHGALPRGYRCEVNTGYFPWFAALGESCARAAVLIVDYGYEQHEYYHPARVEGTLGCYYRHRLHSDPLILPGLQDISAYIDFDACADAAEAAGFEILGLVSQREFLLANGLLDEAQRCPAEPDLRRQLAVSQQVKTLTLPDEMGQRFKVLALQKGISFEMPAMRRRGADG